MKRSAEIPTGTLHSDTEKLSSDLSILRKPIKTSVNGLNEARKAYEDGTEEVGFVGDYCSFVFLFKLIPKKNLHEIFRFVNCYLTNVISFMSAKYVGICFEVWPIS